MRVSAAQKPFNRSGFSTMWVEGTVRFAAPGERSAAVGLFVASAAATLTIAVPTPLAAWAYAFVALTGACWWTFNSTYSQPARLSAALGNEDARLSAAVGNEPAKEPRALGFGPLRDLALLAIASCGALQWITGATVYRYATLDAWTRTVALVATVLVARGALANGSVRRSFLRAFVWFAAIASGTAVLTYFTSPGRILWLFPSPYPDTWGPFLSRNDFAAFLELTFPVALWMGLEGAVPSLPEHLSQHSSQHLSQQRRHALRPSGGRKGDPVYLCVAAWLLAAGCASASRAGSALLAAEAIVILASRATRRAAMQFAAAAAVLIALAGAGTLVERWGQPDPLRERREIQQSALAMIAERPIRGFGIGTFARVYPAYARFDPGAAVEHAHNDWLEWAAEGGLPYALAWVVVAVSVVKPAARAMWGLGVLAVFLHALVDYPFARFGVSAWTMALIGALSADDRRET